MAGLVSLWAVLFCPASGLPADAPNPHAPVRVVLALDTSGSMKANDPRRLMSQAAALMVHLLEERDSLGLLRFDAAPGVILEPGPLTQARRRLGLQQLARLAPQGEHTDLPAVLDAALEAFSGMPAAPRRALALITDGQLDPDPRKGDAASRKERLEQAIIPAYQRANIAIYTVAFTPKADPELLKGLAAATQGEFFRVEKAEDLRNALVRVYESLKTPQLAPLINNRFNLDAGVAEAVLIATREAPDRPVGLTDPLGRQLTPKDARGQVRWFATPAYDLVTISRPRPGVWNLSGCKAGEGKVALLTDLTLFCPQVPAEVGSDEELLVGAAIYEGGRPVTHAELLKHSRFEATLTHEKGEAWQAEFGAPPADRREAWPPGTRVGRFPPVRMPGTARLQIRVFGQTFQRERNFPVRVAGPWYQEVISGGPDSAPGRRTFLPTAKAPSGEMQGWLSVQPASGGLAAALFKPPASGTCSLILSPGRALPLGVDLRLTGTAPSGRLLIIRPAVHSIQAATPDGKNPPPAQSLKCGIAQKLRGLTIPWRQAAASVKAKKGWLLAGLGVWLVMIAAGLLWLARKRWPFNLLPGLGSLLSAADGAPQQERLFLLARIENLEKEKVALQRELDHLSANLRQAAAENAELAKRVDQQTLNFRDKARAIGDLEQKLQEAEIEAKAVQQEYMVLYARSQAEKGIMKQD